MERYWSCGKRKGTVNGGPFILFIASFPSSCIRATVFQMFRSNRVRRIVWVSKEAMYITVNCVIYISTRPFTSPSNPLFPSSVSHTISKFVSLLTDMDCFSSLELASVDSENYLPAYSCIRYCYGAQNLRSPEQVYLGMENRTHWYAHAVNAQFICFISFIVRTVKIRRNTLSCPK